MNDKLLHINQIIRSTSSDKNAIISENERKYLYLPNFNESERKVINLVEERGVAGSNLTWLINQMKLYVENYINVYSPDFYKKNAIFMLNGVKTKGNRADYNIEMISNLSNRIKILDNPKIIVHVTNLLYKEKSSNKDVVKYFKGDTMAYSNISDYEDIDPDTKKIKNVTIDINCVALNGKLTHTFYTNFYHEFNHIYENYKTMLNTNGQVSLGNNGPAYRYDKVVKLIQTSESDSPEYMTGILLYSLWDKTEFNALVTSIYSYLKTRESKRQNYSRDILESQTYRKYIYWSECLRKLRANTDKELWRYIANMFGMPRADLTAFKRSFIKRTKLLLSSFFKQMGKVASLYYDEAEGTSIDNRIKFTRANNK